MGEWGDNSVVSLLITETRKGYRSWNDEGTNTMSVVVAITPAMRELVTVDEFKYLLRTAHAALVVDSEICQI